MNKFVALERFAPGVVTGEKTWEKGLKGELRDKNATSPQNTFVEVNDVVTPQEMAMDYSLAP